MRSRRGVSIIEMITVMVIIGAVMAIVFPRLRISPLQQTKDAANQIAQDIELVRTRALSTRSFVRISFVDGPGGWGAFLDDDRDSVITGSDTERNAAAAFGHRDLPTGVLFGRGTAPPAPRDLIASGPISFANPWVDFDPRGLVAASGQTATIYLESLTDPNAVSAVQLSPAGNVKVLIYRGGSWH
jgi:prepilin-type N-terminal cleavage/methylation domain-containing protein